MASPVLVARQPIFNVSMEVVAYELLHRSVEPSGICVSNPSRATAQVLAGATLDIGFNRLVGACPAYVNCPAALLESDVQMPVGPERIVIEVLEGAEPNPRLLDSLRRLRDQHFRIALDDYDLRRHSAVLLDYADIVKVDIQEYSQTDLESCLATLRRRPHMLIAEKVETAEDFERCRMLGFDLYQGYFLQRPETFAARHTPSSRLTALQLLVMLADSRVSADDVERLISRDMGLSYRVLRCINSSYYGMTREIASIRQAVLLLGFQELRRLCSLVLLAGIEDRPPYVSVQALTRARMCETLCVCASLNGSEGFFMVGLLSMLDVLLGLPIGEAVRALPLSAPIREALVRQEGLLGSALRCVLEYERGTWESLGFSTLTAEQISTAYGQAVQWADSALGAVAGQN